MDAVSTAHVTAYRIMWEDCHEWLGKYTKGPILRY
jgi:hypothetical protein